MTCIRPDCRRPRDRGVHCRKCRQRFLVAQHNARHLAESVGFGAWGWPVYAAADREAYPTDMALQDLAVIAGGDDQGGASNRRKRDDGC